MTSWAALGCDVLIKWIWRTGNNANFCKPLQVIWIWTALNYWMHMPNSSMSQCLLYSKIHKHNRPIRECHSSTNFLSFRQISPKLFVGRELALHCAGTEGETGESSKVTFEPWVVLPPGCGGAQLTHTAQGHHHMWAAEHLPRSGCLLLSMRLAISNKCTAARQKEGRKSGKQFLVDLFMIISPFFLSAMGVFFVRLTLLLWTSS